MGTLDWERDQKQALDASLQASFKKYLVDAGLSASIADQFTQHWTLTGKTFSLVQVDPSMIRPNFSNQACSAADLGWFVDGRPVITQAIKAGEISIEAKSGMTKEEKAKLDLAIDKIGTELHADFHHLADLGGTHKITATNAFVGAMQTGLKVKECKNNAPFAATAGATFRICGYSIKLTPAAVGKRYTLSVTPQDGATAELDAELGLQTPLPVGELRVVRALVEKDGANFKVENLSVLLVGAGG
jgi:hypothetical protein